MFFKNVQRSLTLVFVMGMGVQSVAYGAEDSAAYLSAHKMMQVQDYKTAIKVIKKAQSGGEDTLKMSNMLADAYAQRIDQVGALKQLKIAKKIKATLEHSLELDANNLDAIQGLVSFHTQAPSIAGGDKKQALSFAKKLLALDPLRGHLALSELFAQTEEMDKAKEHIEAAIQLDANNLKTVFSKGVLLAKQGEHAAAIASFEACLVIDNSDINCRYQIGRNAQIGKVEYDKGIAALTDFIAMPVKDKNYLAYAHYRLGNIYSQMGDSANAKIQYQFAIDTGDLKDAKAALKSMK